MKNLLSLSISTLLILLLGHGNLKAQYYDQALGFRAGTSFEVTYKRFIFYEPHIQQSIEGMAGFQLDENVVLLPYDIPLNNGYVFEALWYLHMDLGFDTNFSGFVGAGGYLGAYTEAGKPAFFGGGGTISVGVEYTFPMVPISVSIDWKPILGFPRFSLTQGGITFRYILPTSWQ